MIIWSVNKDNFFSFLICKHFVSFNFLIALARNSSKSNKTGQSRHPCFLPYIRRKEPHVSPLSIKGAIGLFYKDAFNQIENVPTSY